MTEPVHTIDVQTTTGWVRLTVTSWQAFTIHRQLRDAIEPEYLRLSVLAAADPEPADQDEPGRLRLVQDE